MSISEIKARMKERKQKFKEDTVRDKKLLQALNGAKDQIKSIQKSIKDAKSAEKALK